MHCGLNARCYWFRERASVRGDAVIHQSDFNALLDAESQKGLC